MPLGVLLSGGVPWRLFGLIAALATVFAFVVEVKHIGRLEAELSAAAEIAEQYAVVAEQDRKARAHAEDVAAQVERRAESARRAFLRQRREVTDANPSEDGPLAPVLRRVLDGLPVAPIGSGDSTRAAGGSGKSDDLR